MNRLMVITLLLVGVFIIFALFELRQFAFVSILLVFLLAVAIHDSLQTRHTILRNFPVLGHLRYFLELIRPEIQQYFIATNQSDRPFNREIRSLIYQRAKNIRDTIPFGTQLDVDTEGFMSTRHSLNPKVIPETDARVTIGGKDCKQPYSASRLNISAMSFGAISKHAVLALNGGAKKGNFYHNTGEGGLSPYHLEPGGDIVWQLGTGYFGCRTKEGNFDADLFKQKAAHKQVKMIEIKLSQGAKPSHGGILPKAKITEEIAKIRHVEMGKDCLSPPTHSSFDSPKGLLDFVVQLRELSGGKPVGFKLAIGHRSEFFAICKAMVETNILPDFITIDGSEGGTGAAPVEFTDYLAEPINNALVFAHQALTGCGLRDKLHVIASGKVASGFDMVTKLALGADLCNSARGMMFSLGCIQSLQCNANTCPTGVATQNPRLIRGLVVKDKVERVKNFQHNTVHSCLELAGAIGVGHLDQLAPKHIFKRTSTVEGECFEDIIIKVNNNDFIEDNVPEHYAQDWALASSEQF